MELVSHRSTDILIFSGHDTGRKQRAVTGIINRITHGHRTGKNPPRFFGLQKEIRDQCRKPQIVFNITAHILNPVIVLYRHRKPAQKRRGHIIAVSLDFGGHIEQSVHRKLVTRHLVGRKQTGDNPGAAAAKTTGHLNIVLQGQVKPLAGITHLIKNRLHRGIDQVPLIGGQKLFGVIQNIDDQSAVGLLRSHIII